MTSKGTGSVTRNLPTEKETFTTKRLKNQDQSFLDFKRRVHTSEGAERSQEAVGHTGFFGA